MRTPKAITQSAKDEDCTLNIVGSCLYRPETVVYCHFPDGRGGSNRMKGPLHGGYGCYSCHQTIDGQNDITVSKGDMEFYLRRSMNRTINRLIEKGLVTVKGLK